MSDMQTAVDMTQRNLFASQQNASDMLESELISHLHVEHEMGVSAIAKRLSLPRKRVVAILLGRT